MQCSRCRADNRSGRRFCAACGAPLAAACGVCGFANEAEERFCGGCGRPLPSAEPLSPTARAPDTYTPSHLAEKILTARGALEGERKQVTVLFADLKGSMELLSARAARACSRRGARSPFSTAAMMQGCAAVSSRSGRSGCWADRPRRQRKRRRQ